MDDDMVPYERDAVKFVRQVLEGLLFLHDRNIAHLDIKLQNVLLMGTFPDCDVKLCDLEISRIIVPGQEVRELLGTPDYVSPEILHYEPITLSADIWSVGVMAYVLLTGFTPFGGDTDQETFHNICHGQLDFPDELFEDVSMHAEDFIRKTLTREPSVRPTARECLKHPWLTSWKNVASHQRETISSESQRKTSAINGAVTACPRSVAASSINGHNPSSARSLQRAMSKSREVLYERVAASNLRKSTSKSRERLCEMKLSMSRSRDHLCDLQRSMSQSRERLQALKNLSKSHEVLSLQVEGTPSLCGNSLYHILPLAQSLECFTIPPLNVETADVSTIPALVQPVQVNESETADMFALSSAFSESTETLCEAIVEISEEDDELGKLQNKPAEQMTASDDITPSNSRSATPTLSQQISKDTLGAETSVKCSTIPNEDFVINDESRIGKQVDDIHSSSHRDTEKEQVPPKQSESKREELVSLALAPSENNKESAYQETTSSPKILRNGNRANKVAPPPLKIDGNSDSLSPPIASLKSPSWPFGETRLTPSPKSPSSNTSPLFRKAPASPVTATQFKEVQLPPSPAAQSLSCTVKQIETPLTESTAEDVKELEEPRPVICRPKIDTSALSEEERQLLPSILNRRRASWAYGSRQEDVTNKKAEPKLSVAELISNFNKPVAPASSNESLDASKPAAVKKLSLGPVFNSDSAQKSNPTQPVKVYNEKEKALFKPLSTAVQLFEKNTIMTVKNTPTQVPIVRRRNSCDRGSFSSTTESSGRSRPHNFLWEIRALPRLPEDAVCSPREEDSKDDADPIADPSAQPVNEQEPVESSGSAAAAAPDESSSQSTTCSASMERNTPVSTIDDKVLATDEDKYPVAHPHAASETGSAEQKTKNGTDDPNLAPILVEGFLRSGSVSSDTGCSEMSGSDISDRSSDEGQDRRGSEDNSSIPWRGRPRSFSVQADVSFIAQPWNRVCTGAVARAFEKFGTKVEGENCPSSTKSRRQSTPGFKPLS